MNYNPKRLFLCNVREFFIVILTVSHWLVGLSNPLPDTDYFSLLEFARYFFLKIERIFPLLIPCKNENRVLRGIPGSKTW